MTLARVCAGNPSALCCLDTNSWISALLVFGLSQVFPLSSMQVQFLIAMLFGI